MNATNDLADAVPGRAPLSRLRRSGRGDALMVELKVTR